MMEFRINIFARAPEYNIGLDHVDEIRHAAATPNLPLDRILGYACSTTCRHVVVPEDIARASGKFAVTSRIKVTIRATDIAPWWRMVPVVERNEETGEIYEARMKWEFNSTAFLRDWEASGFPDEM